MVGLGPWPAGPACVDEFQVSPTDKVYCIDALSQRGDASFSTWALNQRSFHQLPCEFFRFFPPDLQSTGFAGFRGASVTTGIGLNYVSLLNGV